MGILLLQNVSKHFGGLTAVREITLELQQGELIGLIGPNGSGKTTIFNLISRLLPISSGKIFLKGDEISELPSHRICGLGLGRTFQTPQLFSNMNVIENVMVGCHSVTTCEFVPTGLRLSRWKKEEEWMERRAKEILHFMELDFLAPGERVTSLPYGHQRLVEIGRVLASNPKVLLLDEPAAGLNDQETKELGKILRKIRGLDISVILVEHNMGLVMSVSDRVVVLNYGVKIAEGTPSEIQRNETVIQAYLG